MTKHKNQPKPSDPNLHIDETGLERLIFFSDAVFAIAITLLALEIRLPELPQNVSDAELLTALGNIWPKYLSFAISFLTIGSYWLVHHRIFRNVRRYDSRLMLLNLLLLMTVSFVPFPTALLGEHGNRVGTVFYALTMALVGLLMAVIWWYVAAGGRLLEQPLTAHAFRRRLLRILIAPAVFLLSVGIAFWDPDIAKYSWLLIVLPSLFRRMNTD